MLPNVVFSHGLSNSGNFSRERYNLSTSAVKRDIQSLIRGIAHKLITKQEANTQIKDCLDCYSSTLLESSINNIGDYPVYGAIGLSGYIDNYKTSGESILVIKDGASVGNIQFVTGKYSVIGTLNYLKAKPLFSLRYLYYCLAGFNFAPYKTGMAIPHIYFKDYGNAQIYCPTYSIQEYIADILKALDNKRSIEKNIAKIFLEQKNYLLRNLFI